MKIAIITLIGYYNYGNRLQNYALQRVLEDMGNQVVTIKNVTGAGIKTSLGQRISSSVKDGSIFVKLMNRVNGKKRVEDKLDGIREHNFKVFTNKYIHETGFTIDESTKDFSFDKQLDCYVIGSDQIWNYSFNSFSYLDFAIFSNKPKISYAASFGVSSIPLEYQNLYRLGLSNLAAISVREKVGQQLIEQLTNRKATLVLDPTLLLDRKDWNKLTDNLSTYSNRYIVLYFLDALLPEDLAYIQDFAKKKHLEIKQLGSRSDAELWKSGPETFLNVIKHSEFVFTDSFHACVFSIIFKKDFEVFKRNSNGPSMNSRIDTLLGEFGLTQQFHDASGQKDCINYKSIDKKRYELKKQSLDFLEQSLKEITDKGDVETF